MTISTNRVESFSDGVISIIITIMVFNIKFPHMTMPYTQGQVERALIVLIPSLISYLFSFLIIGIMWLNHHHLFHMAEKVDEKLLWLNLHFLFWLSLIPFPTSMLSGNPLLPESTAIYGGVLFMVSFSFSLMRTYASRKDLMHSDKNRLIQRQIDNVNRRAKLKNFAGMAAYFVAIPMAYVSVYISFACFIIPPILFFIPDGIDNEKLGEQVAEKLIKKNEDASNTISG